MFELGKSNQWISKANFASWWFSWDDLSWPNVALRQKWEQRAKIFSQAGINTVIVFGFHFRWDFLNVFDRIEGILKEVTEICHAHGLRIIDHHSTVFSHHARSLEDRQFINKQQNHHVPFYPDSWNNQIYQGNLISDWLMISATDNKPVYYENYRAHIFCPNNPDFLKSYCNYVTQLFANVDMDGLMADDIAFLPDFYACSCKYCRENFTRETEFSLPDITDTSFWNNLDSPAFQAWVECRFKWCARFYQKLREQLPSDIPIWSCQATNIMPHVCSQGSSYEYRLKYCDATFLEIFHGLDPIKDQATIVAELSVARSLADIAGNELVVICYGRKKNDFALWGKMLERVKARPWFCHMVRDENIVQEEDLFKDGYPEIKPIQKIITETCVIFSTKIRNKLGPNNNSYYNAFITICDQLWEQEIPFDILFDNHWPIKIHNHYKIIHAPMKQKLTPLQQDILNTK